MTAPLTPHDCDLQDFPFMPLHVARLRDSDLAAEESPEACWYAVLLWAASWHQLPAGSLPDNDAVLTKLIGLGRDVKTFRKHKAGAMRGFVMCSDGRLYHPIVAEQVTAAWESKLQQRWRTECARIKKANQRNDTDLKMPTYEEFLARTSRGQIDPSPQPVPGDVQGDSANCPEGNGVQETGTGTGNIKKPPTPLEGGQKDLLGDDKPDETAGRRKPKRPIPEGFPTSAEIDLQQLAARTAGADVDIAYQAERFRNWALGKDARYADWPKTWANWCLKTIKEAPKRPGIAPAALAVDQLDVWRRRVKAFVSGSGFWNTTDWEAQPGRPGCIVPPAILLEFDLEPATPQGAAA